MKFALLIITDEELQAKRSPAEIDALVARHRTFQEALRAAGKSFASQRLRLSSEASTLRPAGERPIVTDGPFAESKEQLGGFYLIDADSRAEAIEWAKKLPLAGGAIEVRPVWEMG